MIIKSNQPILKNYLGEDNISKIYAGENLVFGHDEPTEIKNYLALTAITDTNVGFKKHSNGNIQYSSDGNNWTEYNLGENETMILPAGETLYFKGNNTHLETGPLGQFVLKINKQKAEVSGNVMSLIYGDNFENKTTMFQACFTMLFFNCKALVSAENLILPANTLSDSCYMSMFSFCGNLTTAPELPATTLAQSCYMSMFQNCGKLTTAPVLPATTLTHNCYQTMFDGCSSLTYIKALFEGNPSNSYMYNMTYNVNDEGTFVMNKNATWDPEDYEDVFSEAAYNWTFVKDND